MSEATTYQKKIASERIVGIDRLELDFANALLWECGVYTEIVMDDTQPLIMVAPEDLTRAQSILSTASIIKGK
ncbi:MAG TPA: hypothetical protein VN521_05660 [Negativicutes bacterium]|nr:hypothetical protein [Negativicutes bacterium]